MSQADIAAIDTVIRKGQEALATHSPNPSNVIGFPTLASGPFQAWRTHSLSLIQRICGTSHVYYTSFDNDSKRGAYRSVVDGGIGLLRSLRDELEDGLFNTEGGNAVTTFDPLTQIDQICSRFHAVARQLRVRREERPTLDVADEYDVQDLLHALLTQHFNDIRPEEWAPSYAGKASRSDFLLKTEEIVVEAKKTRRTLGAKQLGSELIEDIARYESHPNCKALVCFVYDPEGHIANPRGIENDLNRESPFPVRVLIRPQH